MCLLTVSTVKLIWNLIVFYFKLVPTTINVYDIITGHNGA